jgi:hypothetical protein
MSVVLLNHLSHFGVLETFILMSWAVVVLTMVEVVGRLESQAKLQHAVEKVDLSGYFGVAHKKLGVARNRRPRGVLLEDKVVCK